MKRIILQLMLLPLLVLSSCSNDDGDSTIIIDKDQLKQSAYADDAEKGITFTATEAWRTEVDYVGTKAETTPEQWVSLDPPSGEAGEVTIKVVLSTNYTGADRKATIRIICGNTTITVVIEQKGTDEEGEVPDEENQIAPTPGRKIVQVISYEDGKPFYVDMTYNEQGQIIKHHTHKVENGNRQDTYEEEFTYSGNQIVSHFTGWDEGYVSSGTTTYTVSDGRIIRSESRDDDGTQAYTYTYDEAGRLTQYKEEYDDNIEYTYTYTWENDLLVSSVESNGSSAINYHYEYYDLATLPSQPASLVIQWLPEECQNPDMAIYGWTGTHPRNYIKKITISKDEWNKENGTAVYRYETDGQGYITKIYRAWTPEGKTSEPESLYMELTYE